MFPSPHTTEEMSVSQEFVCPNAADVWAFTWFQEAIVLPLRQPSGQEVTVQSSTEELEAKGAKAKGRRIRNILINSVRVEVEFGIRSSSE